MKSEPEPSVNSGDNSFSRAGDVLKVLFEKLIPEGQGEYVRFFSGWEQIAGSQIAMHVVPKDVSNHVLLLETDHPGWTQKIRFMQEDLLSSIKKRYPELDIRRIKVRVANKTKKTEEKAKTPVESPASSEFQLPKAASDDEKAFFNLLENMRRNNPS